jgi:hypothetical protein
MSRSVRASSFSNSSPPVAGGAVFAFEFDDTRVASNPVNLAHHGALSRIPVVIVIPLVAWMCSG